MYRPTEARWASVDPFLTDELHGWYSYADNNALSKIDPSGLQGIFQGTIPARIFAGPAFGSPVFYHLCIEVEDFDESTCQGCARPTSKGVLHFELLDYSDHFNRAGGPNNRIGWGPSDAGFAFIWDIYIPPRWPWAWGIFEERNGRCKKRTGQGYVFAMSRDAIGLADDATQCRLAQCLITQARSIATTSTQLPVYYRLFTRNSNSFITETICKCHGYVDDDFFWTYVVHAPAWRNAFTTGQPHGCQPPFIV